MADVKEYLIRFKGDTSQIEAAADRLQAKVERISDTEVKLRVNLGKDKADVKPFLDMIKKIDPEVHAKMIVDGLDDLKTAEDRLEQIRKIEKDIGSVDAIKSTLTGYSKAVNDAEKKAGETLDNTETIRILKEALDYVESIGDAANNATLKPLINGLKEAVPYYSELKDYKPKNLLADKDAIKKTRDALKSNLSLVETPKLTADTSEATDAVEKLKDKTDEVVDGMSQTGKVKIFDGISTQIYDVIEDADKLEAKLKEIASSWGQVGWHGGSDPRSGHLSDTLGRMLRTGDDGPSAGTGTYFTQNLKDVLNWIGPKSHKDVFAADLSRLSGMVTLPSDDYFYDLSDLFKAINAFVANDFFPNKRYETVLEDFKSNSPTETLQKIFKYYENIFKDMGISFEQFSTFINGQKSFLADYEKTHIDMPEEDFFNSLENNITTRFNKTFATNFFQMFTGASGINASNLHLTDSSELGTVIFDFLRQSIPMIDFGGNTNIAEAFYKMTLGNLIKSKARNPDVDLEDLLYTYTGRKRKEGLLPEHTKLLEEARQIQSGAKPATYQELNGDRIQEEIKAQKELANAREEAAKRIKEAGDEYQRQLDEEEQLFAEKRAREEEYRRQEEKAAREAAEEERRYAEEMERRSKIEDEQRLAEEYKRQLEKKVRDANEQALREQEAQRSHAVEHDVFADQYAKETEGERQLTAAINERAEAADRAATKLKNAESQNVVDDILKRQELTRKYNEQLYESKGALPSPDDYDSYYDSDGISRFIEQTKEARIETENLNDAIRDGSVQSDDISKHTEDLKEDSKAANENAEANKKAAEAKKESTSVHQEPERDLSAESLDLDKEASLRRLDVLEKKLREVGGASKELENDLVDARKAIGSAVDTKELGVANKKVRNITDDVNEYIKQKNIEVDYSDQLSSFEKLKNEIVESTAVSEAFKDSVKGAFDSFKDASASTKNIERIKEAIKETTKEFKEYAKASAADNSKANTRFSNYVDRLNSYDLDKYTPEVRQKILDLRDEISKMPKDAAGNFKIDLNDEEVVKQVNRIDGAMKDLKAAVSSADGVVANGISVKKLNEQMAQFVNKNHKLTAEYKQEVKELRQALSEEGLTKSGYMDILGQYKDLQARASDEGLVGGVGNLENLGNQIKRMSTNFVAQYFSLYDIVRYAKEIGQSVTEINSAQTELRKVSDASQTRIQENFQKSAETAQEMGATISDVINSTSDWARLGYSVDEAEVLARNTALYQTVGDNMTQESASEYMTSIMKGYQYDADQSESIIDKVNEVANNYSIDTQGKYNYALAA